MFQNKSTIAFSVFVAAGIAGLGSDFVLGAWWGWKDAHTLSHFFFGLGFPHFWVAIFSAERRPNRYGWQISFDNYVAKCFGDGFKLGVAITASWSLWNEVIEYHLYNPVHPADWHHWIADQAGIIAAYAVLQAATNRSFNK